MKKKIRAWAVISKENKFIYSHECDRELMTIFHSHSSAELFSHDGNLSNGENVSKVVEVEISIIKPKKGK